MPATIRTGQDALELDDYGACDSIITNPPWSRDVMHRLIMHFQDIAPTWLLLDADWKQNPPGGAVSCPHCSDIVAIGRVKWIEGSKHTGKGQCLFGTSSISGTRADLSSTGANHGEVIPPRTGVCEQLPEGLRAAAI